MSDNELISQWKNPQTRAADLVHPAGDISLDDVVGGMPPQTESFISIGCCATRTLACPV
ncbi:hypothetical protein Sme01_19970 [Sphaerisporangium melleum]|uniref:Mersacidin/lichenicidin family type 2 lantibiotic n=1 Tax=Sphaerisporangium melleum TaxID=321316 RepID=A0A917VS53_9ACTN|nr:hypothetical protein [Sphaerisporangium melleum]GGL13262.1 hypothetical protein GCM10007964_64220 [Sphaerisporangium melleum]GII69521.1 hypothetical protein Sme01_19970 [Sphaerisporangium melleum]